MLFDSGASSSGGSGTIFQGNWWMPHGFDWNLVGLSVLIAVFASYTALDLVERARAASTPVWRRNWLYGAAVAMGGGIWAMHFVGMLALDAGMTIGYRILPTLVSLLVPILVCAGSLFWVVMPDRAARDLVLAGTGMGFAIAFMHYVGLTAMHRLGGIVFYPLPLVVSTVIAVVASICALGLAAFVTTLWSRIGSSFLMALGISGMHYTGMGAVGFSPAPAFADGAGVLLVGGPSLAVGVAGITFLVLLIALGASFADQRNSLLQVREVETLRRSERRFQRLLQNASDCVLVLDLAGTIGTEIYAIQRNLGYTDDEVRGRRLFDLALPQHQALVRSFLADVMASQGVVVTREMPLRHADGTLRDFEVAGTWFVQEPDTVAIVANLRDVTERKRLEERLRHMQKVEALGQLTGGVAHDFNNLLTIIMGNVELARRRTVEEPVRRLLHPALAAACRGRDLTRQLLVLSRQQPLDPVALSLNELVHGVVEIFSRSLGDRIVVEVRLDDALWPIHADRTQFESVILNLAFNARDAMPSGGTLTFSTFNRVFDEADAARHEIQPGSYAVLQVSDTGTGIAPDLIDRIFDPFFTTKEIGKGTGLGLSLAFSFIRQSAGFLKVSSDVGTGTVMTIFLPRHIESAPAAPSIPRPEVSLQQGGGEPVLVVEDDAQVRTYAVEVLCDLGYRAVEAQSPAEALAILEGPEDVALLFTDVLMPDMNGQQLARRALALRPDLKVLFASGYANSPLTNRARVESMHVGVVQIET